MTSENSGSRTPAGDSQQADRPEIGIPKPAAQSLNVTNEPGKSASRIVKKIDPVVAKTKLDLDACRDVVDKLMAEKEVKIQEQLKTNPPVPAKPKDPIERSTPATPCGMAWDNSFTKERFIVCSSCTRHVYDFSHMELSEAENLVFQRENKKKPSFFKRSDGKYLTVDCPVGIARQRTRIIGIAACVVGLIAAVVVLSLMPKPQPPAEAIAPQTVPPAGPGRQPSTGPTGSPAAPSSASNGYSPPAGLAPNGAPMLRIGDDGQVVQGGELLGPGSSSTGPGAYQGTTQSQQYANSAPQTPQPQIPQTQYGSAQPAAPPAAAPVPDQPYAPSPQVVAPASQGAPANESAQPGAQK